MPKRSFTALALAALVAALPAATAQEVGSKSQSSDENKVHVEGCVYPEAALTAPAPIIVAVGSTHTWVLTQVQPIAGKVTADEAGRTSYTLGKVDQEQLRVLSGKRVAIVGHVGSGASRPGIDVISIREVSGGCPTLPRQS